MERFLKVNKKYFDSGLKALDILILSQIEEFSSKDMRCTLKDEALSEMFGASPATVKRSILKLDRLGLVNRGGETVTINGNPIRKRHMSINYEGINEYLSDKEEGNGYSEENVCSEDDGYDSDTVQEHGSDISHIASFLKKELDISTTEDEIGDIYRMYVDSGTCSWHLNDLTELKNLHEPGMGIVDYINAISSYRFRENKR